ncbi:MAG TPA: MIP/aquaporin family protein [Caulobacterales bacterium]|nr:MIP/aquaporin family protein [Caulobacterales bacterium]
MTLSRRIAAEFAGSLVLTAVVIGSGIMGDNLAGGNVAIALLANTLATGAILFVLVHALGPISGAHFNPAVTLVMTLQGATKVSEAPLYIALQIGGCIAGAMFAHALFGLPLIQQSAHVRAGAAQALSEGAATFALIACILLVSRTKPDAIPLAVALTIAAGYWWTPSTSFANPAITIARALSDTFAGIRPQDAPTFIAAQCAGAVLAWAACAWLYRLPFRAANAVSTAAATRSVSNSGG